MLCCARGPPLQHSFISLEYLKRDPLSVLGGDNTKATCRVRGVQYKRAAHATFSPGRLQTGWGRCRALPCSDPFAVSVSVWDDAELPTLCQCALHCCSSMSNCSSRAAKLSRDVLLFAVAQHVTATAAGV